MFLRRQDFSLWTIVVVTAFLELSAAADNWPNWRGPNGNGSAAMGDYPIEWGSNKHIDWHVPLPGRAGSTPAVWGDRIYLTCEDGRRNLVLALDRSGEIIWKRHIGTVRAGKHRKGTGCNPSPVTDGSGVFVYFKSGDLAAIDKTGDVAWTHNLQEQFGEDTLWWDLGTSPVVSKDSVIVACMQSDSSYIAAFNKADGRLLWKKDRNLPAPDEANQSYTTPVLTRHGSDELLIVAGADHVTAHDVESGDEIWRVGGLNPEQNGLARSIASPVLMDRRIFVPYSRGARLTAIDLGGHGDVTKTHVAWVRDGFEIDVPTPAADRGTVFLCSDRGEVQALRPSDGNMVWTKKLPRSRDNYSSSPIVTTKHLYATREDGTTFVIQIDEPHGVVSENSLGEMTVSTPVLVEGRIYLQTFENLYCIAAR